MDKNIYKLQNHDFILQSLVVQSKLYSKCKKINFLHFFLCAVFPIGYSLIKNLWSNQTLIIIGSLLTITLLFVTPYLSEYAANYQKRAAKVQQTIDFLLFEDNSFKTPTDDWGELYTQDELLEMISKVKISQEDIQQKRNWYSDYSSYPHVMQAYYSQCECSRWDGDLRKWFVKFLLAIGISVLIITTALALFFNMTLLEFLINIITFAPLIKFLIPIKKQLTNDINRLHAISHIQRTINNQFGVIIGGEELYPKIIKIQNQLFEHRSKALTIPDFFYSLLRRKQQKTEDVIAECQAKKLNL